MKHFFRNKQWTFINFWLSISALYALIFVGIEFSDNPYSSPLGLIKLIIQWSVVAVATTGVLCLMTINRYVFALTFPPLILLSAILGYYRMTIGVSLTPMVIELAIVNDAKTWGTVISTQLVLIMAFSCVVSGLLVRYRYKYINLGESRWLYIVFGILLMSLTCVPRFRPAVVSRMPFSFYHSVKAYMENRTIIKEHRFTFNSMRVEASYSSPDVVVIIGESLRADHLPQNGYHRNTLPHLMCDSTVVSYPNVSTEPWCTHTSVPRIMTRADSTYPDAAYKEQSFITLFKNAGYHTAWLSNQDVNPTYVYFMHEADTLVMGNATKSVYNFDKWLDSDLLPSIDSILNENHSKNLLVIHTIGSHWWYRSHYPDSLAVFTPEIDSRVLSDLTTNQLINSYDNTILATDYFIREVIERFKDRNSIIIYISDHGEALGEDGNYLHAEDYAQLHNPACLIWYSVKYAGLFPEKVTHMKQAASYPWTTDAIFHSVLDGADLKCDILDRKSSFFSGYDIQ